VWISQSGGLFLPPDVVDRDAMIGVVQQYPMPSMCLQNVVLPRTMIALFPSDIACDLRAHNNCNDAIIMRHSNIDLASA
jgi:hypothetical protein